MLFDLNPREVITSPQNYPYHCKRIYKADISYPICMTTYQDREIVIDGIHRLTKIVERKIRTIKVKILNEDVVQQIAEYA